MAKLDDKTRWFINSLIGTNNQSTLKLLKIMTEMCTNTQTYLLHITLKDYRLQ